MRMHICEQAQASTETIVNVGTQAHTYAHADTISTHREKTGMVSTLVSGLSSLEGLSYFLDSELL